MEKVIPNITYTVKHDLCTGCGICENACPSKAIQMSVAGGRFVPKVDNIRCINSKGCHRCMDACPGVGIDMQKRAQQLHEDPEIKEHELSGRYLQCYTGYSKDVELRERAASGGLVSQFLIWLLEQQLIDGAVVTQFDKNAPLKVKSFIATTRQEVLSAKGSKYAPVSLHGVLNAVKKAEGNRYVIVGLPCHVQGLRKLMDADRKLREKVVGIFSLFCSGSQTFHYTSYILGQCGGNVESLDYLAYREGYPTGMVAKGKGFAFFKEYGRYNRPLKGTFYPRRCLLCVDMFGELADINFGDIHVEQPEEAGTGINAVIVRNAEWQTLLQQAALDGAIGLSDISMERMLRHRSMAKAKKTRNASFVLLLKKLGLKAPEYDSNFRGTLDGKVALRYMAMRAKQYIGRHRSLWFLLPPIK